MQVVPGTYDYLGTITQAVTDLVTGHSGLLYSPALALWKTIATVMLILVAIKAAAKGMQAAIHDLIGVLTMASFSFILLHYYDNPLPWFSYSIRQFFPEFGRQIASLINASALDDVNKAFDMARSNTPQPGLMQIGEWGAYWSMMISISIAQAIMFYLTSVGFTLAGIFGLLGILGIPFIQAPRFSKWFYGWIDVMLQVSMYQVVGAAYVFIWAHVWLRFIDDRIAGDYSLEHWLTVFHAMVALNFAMIFTLPLAIYMLSGWIGGGAAAGAGFIGSVVSSVSRVAVPRGAR